MVGGLEGGVFGRGNMRRGKADWSLVNKKNGCEYLEFQFDIVCRCCLLFSPWRQNWEMELLSVP